MTLFLKFCVCVSEWGDLTTTEFHQIKLIYTIYRKVILNENNKSKRIYTLYQYI